MTIHANVHIDRMTREQIPATKSMIISVWNEVLGLDHTVARWDKGGYFDDINHFESKLITFLVLLDNDTVVGSAGIKSLGADICELKRMWITKPYRKQGWGNKLLTMLLAEAQSHGFTRMRLEVWSPNQQTDAVAFYRASGFYAIAPYCESQPDSLFMEKLIA